MPNKRFNKQVPGFGFKNGGRAMKAGGGRMISGTRRKDEASGFYSPDMGMRGGSMYKKLIVFFCHVSSYFFFNLRNVIAKRARCPSFPGFLAAAFNFDAGIVLPFLIPRDFLRDPGFFIAFWINFLSFVIYFLLCTFQSLHLVSFYQHLVLIY